jgi:hypothetical protein
VSATRGEEAFDAEARCPGTTATGPARDFARAAKRQLRGGRIVRSSRAVSCPRPDGTLIVDVDAGRRSTLDWFGCRVWTLLAEQPTLPGLVLQLRDEGTSAERLAEDVSRLLATWHRAGLIALR